MILRVFLFVAKVILAGVLLATVVAHLRAAR